MHTTGGYAVQTYLTSKLIFDLKPDDVYWCTADIGWVTGHSYVVYGILQNGVTTVMYERAPNYPEADRLSKIVNTHKVTVFYTAPTAVRAAYQVGRPVLRSGTRSPAFVCWARWGARLIPKRGSGIAR